MLRPESIEAPEGGPLALVDSPTRSQTASCLELLAVRPIVAVRSRVGLLPVSLTNTCVFLFANCFLDGLADKLGPLPLGGWRDLVQCFIGGVIELNENRRHIEYY